MHQIVHLCFVIYAFMHKCIYANYANYLCKFMQIYANLCKAFMLCDKMLKIFLGKGASNTSPDPIPQCTFSGFAFVSGFDLAVTGPYHHTMSH